MQIEHNKQENVKVEVKKDRNENINRLAEKNAKNNSKSIDECRYNRTKEWKKLSKIQISSINYALLE